MSYASLFLPKPILEIIGGTGSNAISGGVLLQLPKIALSIGAQQDGDGTLTLPAPVLAITGYQSAIGGVSLTLPHAGLAVTGREEVTGFVSLALPTLRIAALVDQTGVTLRLPYPTVAVTGALGCIGGVDFDTFQFSLASTGVTGDVAHVVLEAPRYALAITGFEESRASVRLVSPAPAIHVTGAVGVTGAVVLALPTPATGIAGTTQYVGGASLRLLPTMSIGGSTGGSARIALTLRGMALAIAGGTGTIGTASMALPVHRVSAAGVTNVVGEVVLTVPLLVLHATGARAVGANYGTVVMHTESNTLTTYSNYEFNSFAQFNGVYLGAKSDGIFALSGATDNGALIAAAAKVGITDFATSHLKRVERCYVGYSTSGEMILRVITDGDKSRDYLLTPTGKNGVHGNHVRIGRGVEARYWQFEILNKGGADFELDMLEFKPTVLRRRVGGGNA